MNTFSENLNKNSSN